MRDIKMSEEDKKTRPVEMVFKYIGGGILVLYLTAAFIFKMPWKITAVFSIILFLCIILPRRMRKWLWLSVCVILMGVLIWVFLPEDNQGWRPYSFDEELAAHEAKYAVAESENAATIYNKLLPDFNPKEWRLRFLHPEALRLTLSGPWLSQNHPELTQWLIQRQKTIKELPEACQIKKCRFPSNIKLTRTDNLETNRYFALRSWAVWLLFSANNDIAEGRPDQALSKYLYALQMAEHLHQQKRIIDFLIGFEIEDQVLRLLNRFVVEDKPTEQQLQLISKSLRNLDNNWQYDFLACIEYDKLFAKNTFCGLVYQTNPQGKVRISRDPAAGIWGYSRKRVMAETYWQKKSMKTFAILAWFFLPATPKKAAEMIDETYEKCLAMAEPDFSWDKEDISSMPSLELNCRFLVMSQINKSTRFYGRFHDIYLKRLAQCRGLRLLIAIKQHQLENGCWPAELNTINTIKASVPPEAFIDPVTGKEFEYENQGERFSLYGKTANIWPRYKIIDTNDARILNNEIHYN